MWRVTVPRTARWQNRPIPYQIRERLAHNGYLGAILMSDAGKATTVSTHRVVALAFHGIPSKERDECSHKNGVKTDNRPANLEWLSHRENIAEKRKHGTQPTGENHHAAKLNWAIVKDIRSRKNQSFTAISKELGVSISAVARVVAGITWVE